MMFCEKCGHKLEEDSLFCENCGTPTGKKEAVPQTPAAPVVPVSVKGMGKRKGGKTAVIMICIVLAVGLIGTGAFFLIRHFTGGGSGVPPQVLEQVNESGRPEDYEGPYRGQVSFAVDVHVPPEELGALESKMERLQSMNGRTYDVTAKLEGSELIVFCPDAPAADPDGELIRLTIDPGQVQKGIARGTKTEGIGAKMTRTDTEVYLTKDGGLYVDLKETLEEDGKVLASVDSTLDLKPTTPPQQPTEVPSEPTAAVPTETEEIPTVPETQPVIQEKEPTARYHEIPEDHILFRNWSTAAVQSGPPEDIRITLNKDIYIEAIMNWHWFVTGPDEYRTATIALEDADTGKVFGPWAVQCDSAENGQNMGAWIVFPETVIPAGDYILRDSNLDSWSYVPEDTRDCGMTEIKGRLPEDKDMEVPSGTYHAVFIGEAGEPVPPLDTLTPFEPPFPLVLLEDGTGTITLPDSVVTFTLSGTVMHAVDDTGYESDIQFRQEGDALILTNPRGTVLIFIRQDG